MSKQSVLQRPLGRGFLLAGLLYCVATLVVASFALVVVAVGGGRDGGLQAVEALLRDAGAATRSAARFAAEPAGVTWADLERAQGELTEAPGERTLGPVAELEESRELGRLLDTMLPERHQRLAQTWGAIEILGAGAGAPEARLAARASLDAPLAAYLRTVEQIEAQAERVRSFLQTAARRSAVAWMVLTLLFAVLALVGASAFLAGFSRGITQDVRSLTEYAGRIARGEYPGKLPADRGDVLGVLGRSIERLTGLEKALHDVREIGASFRGSSQTIGAQVEASVGLGDSQTGRIENATRKLDDIVQAVQSVYTNARRSLETAQGSGQEIQTSIDKLLQGSSDVRRLEELTNRIEEIVSHISSIADQTDILSLNAGIEAARAGASGRGFTVVASEVRKLADRSGRSALEIAEITQSILAVVQKIASRTNEESLVLSSIQKGLGRIAEVVGKVTDVSAAVRSDVERLSKAMDEITTGMSDTRREAGGLAKSAQTLREDVDRLTNLGSVLGFSGSTASFAAWRAEDAEVPPGDGPAQREAQVTERPTEDDARAATLPTHEPEEPPAQADAPLTEPEPEEPSEAPSVPLAPELRELSPAPLPQEPSDEETLEDLEVVD